MNRIGAIFQINYFLKRDLMTTKYLAVSFVDFQKKIDFIHKIGEFLLEKALVTLKKTCFPSFIL